ncbi:LysE family translocator [Nonomuraea sp. NPDC050536]|uniref:LysE family translocator n=1 Tax=Nonomuraea sp. NPDC050536 TaxID=3364366 RepID=UPI0037CB123E
MDSHALILFLGVDFLLIFTPGPDFLYIVARSLGQGRRAGLTAVAGICSGYVIHSVLAAAGLVALLRAVPAALPIIRYGGAAYLAFLAIRTLLTLRRSGTVPGELAPESTRTVLRQSLLTALLNPKGLLLYLSLMPQFITPDAPMPVGLQLLALGLLHVVCCGTFYALFAVTAARIGRTFTRTPKAARRMTALSGVMLLIVSAVTLRPN